MVSPNSEYFRCFTVILGGDVGVSPGVSRPCPMSMSMPGPTLCLYPRGTFNRMSRNYRRRFQGTISAFRLWSRHGRRVVVIFSYFSVYWNNIFSKVNHLVSPPKEVKRLTRTTVHVPTYPGVDHPGSATAPDRRQSPRSRSRCRCPMHADLHPGRGHRRHDLAPSTDIATLFLN